VTIIGLPLTVLFILSPEPIFAAITEIILAIATIEIIRNRVVNNTRHDLLILGTGAAATAFIAASIRVGVQDAVWILLIPTAIIIWSVFTSYKWTKTTIYWWIMSVIYISTLGSHFILINQINNGQNWIILMLGIVFATDTGAYTIGKLFGKHKLIPSISPNKTWEGAFGGYFVGILIGGGIIYILNTNLSISLILLFSCPVIAMIGDIIESQIKRKLSVKDISNILPGHGGILDRIDSILFTAPWVYWVIIWIN
jgi:phosphatidate cytidylyltransferase